MARWLQMQRVVACLLLALRCMCGQPIDPRWLPWYTQTLDTVGGGVDSPTDSPGSGNCRHCLSVVMLTHFDDLTRALLSSASLQYHLPASMVREVLLVVPREEEIVIRRVLAASMVAAERPLPLRVVAESSVLNITAAQLEVESLHKKYSLQMVLKLFVAGAVQTPFYLVMDSDVLTMLPVTTEMLFPEPLKASYQKQRRGMHSGWWSKTEAFMQLEGYVSKDKQAKLFGVTPAILATEISLRAMEHIRGLFGEQYLQVLLQAKTFAWTEYCTYRLIAEKFGLFDKYHSGAANVTLYDGMWLHKSWDPKTTRKQCSASVFCVIQSIAQVPVRHVFRTFARAFITEPLRDEAKAV